MAGAEITQLPVDAAFARASHADRTAVAAPTGFATDVAIRRIDPERDAPAWTAAVRTVGTGTLAHAPEWAHVVRRAYGHEPLYLSGSDAAGRPGVLPAVIVRRPVGGTVVASMPFLDGGGPCAESSTLAGRLTDALIAEARKAGARTVELRCDQPLTIAVRAREHKVNLALRLPGDPDVLWRGLEKTVRNQIRKAERSGLSSSVGGSELLDEFYNIHVARMRDLGSPAHDRRFFHEILAAFAPSARIVVVRKGATAVGGLLALTAGEAVVVPWASCLKEYFALCPNMLMYWHAIRSACEQGARSFDFGRSTIGSGTYRFKRQWGAAERPLHWYTLRLDGRRDTTDTTAGDSGRAARAATAIWQRLPAAVTGRIGPRIRKYLIQ